MKTKNLFLALAMSGSLFISTACSDDDTPNSGGTVDQTVPENVIAAFNEMYPSASQVTWGIRDDHAFASFHDTTTRSDGQDRNKRAWFLLLDGRWDMTETEMPYEYLPDSVRLAFEASEYAAAPWQLEDRTVEALRRNGSETLWVIEVEKRENNVETDADLYYMEDGFLAKIIFDADENDDRHGFLPQEPGGSVAAWLDEHFPEARVVDVDSEYGLIEVEFIHGGMKHEAVFDTSQSWLYTKTELERRRLSEVPAAVLEALRTSPRYTSDGDIDDIDRYETRETAFYAFELETRFDVECTVYVSADGQLLDSRPDLGTGGGGLDGTGEIGEFIASRYPGAVIREFDEDDGYIEVEILHNGMEKEVIFNARLQWVRTTWEIGHASLLPAFVLEALEREGFPLHAIDNDSEAVETEEGVFYFVELDAGNVEGVVVDGTGNVVRVIYDD